MFSHFGLRPAKPLYQRCLAACAIVFILPATSSLAATPLTLAEAERLALRSEPGRQALREHADALREQATAARQLPDPVLRIGLNNYPVESGGFSTEGMTNAGIGLRQTFPGRATLSLREERYAALSRGMQDRADARGRDVATAVRAAWLDAWYWQRSRELVTESRPLFADLAEITTSLYAVGRKSQQDVLRAELELSRIDDRLIEIDRQHAAAVAALREWIGDDAERPLAGSTLVQSGIPDESDLMQRLNGHPALLAATAHVTASEREVDLAEERGKPSWSLDVGYSYREGSLASGVPRSDFVSVGVTVDLPFFRRTAVDSNLSAALHTRSAAAAEREQLKRQLVRQLESEFARWRDLERRLVLYDERILVQSHQHAEAALLAYQNDRADFDDVMRAYIEDLNTQIEHIRLQAEQGQSYALLANLGGITDE